MKKVLLSALAFLCLQLHAQQNIIPGQMIVWMNKHSNANEVIQNLNQQNPGLDFKAEQCLSLRYNIWLLNYNFQQNSYHKAITSLHNNAFIRIAQANHSNIILRDTCPNDTDFGDQWDMYNDGTNGGGGTADIDACGAWEYTKGGYTTTGDRIVAAVIDGGVDLNHPDLSVYINPGEIAGNSIDDDGNGYIDDVNGWNAGANNGNTNYSSTWDSHGTHVCGTVGAKGNNNLGVTGINWDVDILTVKGSSGNESTVVAAYSYVAEMRARYNETNGAEGAFVVSTNSSFGVDNGDPADYPLWCAMYDTLGALGILSATATANNNVNVDNVGDIPTACPSDWMISVTNTTSNDTKATAGYGATTIDLGAPGTNIISTYPNDTYDVLSGTSMATPHICGTVALMIAAACPQFINDYKTNPATMALVIKDLLLNQGVDQIPALNGITVTGGRLNLQKAIEAVVNYTLCAGIDEIEYQAQMAVYPNPAEDMVTVKNIDKHSIVKVSLSDITGKLLHTYNENELNYVNPNEVRIQVSDISTGVYFLDIATSNGQHGIARLVKN